MIIYWECKSDVLFQVSDTLKNVRYAISQSKLGQILIFDVTSFHLKIRNQYLGYYKFIFLIINSNLWYHKLELMMIKFL